MYFAMKQAHTALAVLYLLISFFFFLFFPGTTAVIFSNIYPKYSLIQYHNHESYKKGSTLFLLHGKSKKQLNRCKYSNIHVARVGEIVRTQNTKAKKYNMLTMFRHLFYDTSSLLAVVFIHNAHICV